MQVFRRGSWKQRQRARSCMSSAERTDGCKSAETATCGWPIGSATAALKAAIRRHRRLHNLKLTTAVSLIVNALATRNGPTGIGHFRIISALRRHHLKAKLRRSPRLWFHLRSTIAASSTGSAIATPNGQMVITPFRTINAQPLLKSHRFPLVWMNLRLTTAVG